MKKTLSILLLLFVLPASAVRDCQLTGIASWYGKQHQGKTMANGQKFDRFKMTAASPCIELGANVRVLNVRNGKTVDVTITDRGPHVGSRVIDLSQAAAQKIGITGLGRVSITRL